MLKLAQIRKTTRRTKGGDARVVFPHFLRDRSLAPRIEVAVRYFESMVGRQRHDMDAEMIVQLFGDHKLANCLVDCLASWYRYYPRTLAGELAEDELAKLRDQGIANASDLRLWLYRLVNSQGSGFVSASERVDFLKGAASKLGLDGECLERLSTLDAPANAVLVRTGAVPTPDEVIARYNFEVAAALLSNAKLARMTLAQVAPAPDAVAELCRLAGVRADFQRTALVLHGRQDALNGWSRHGARVAMVLTMLLAFGLPARTGEVIVAIPDGGEWLFRMDDESLGYLGADSRRELSPGDVRQAVYGWCASERLVSAFAASHRAGGVADWMLRRSLDAVVDGEGLSIVTCTLVRGTQRVPVAVAPNNASSLRHLAQLAAKKPIIALLAAETSSAVVARETGLAGTAYIATEDLSGSAHLPDLAQRALDFSERHMAAMQLDRAFAEAHRAGVMIESRVAEYLGCSEDEVATYLERPTSRRARERAGLRYVVGFGLCSTHILDRAREAAADVARLRGTEPVGPAWTLRVLGRKLREVTGVSEGIECLIAYLGAA